MYGKERLVYNIPQAAFRLV